MASRWGFGWMGSKNKIAEQIVALLPAGECLVDLFAGGCAITHCAIVSGKWKRFVANDIKGTAVFFKQAIEGKVSDLYEWISREEFFARRDHDVKVAACWSFGNTGDAYLYSREIEPLKRAMYDLFFAETPYKRRMQWRYVIRELHKWLVYSEAGNQHLNTWLEERRVLSTCKDDDIERLNKIIANDRYSKNDRAFINRVRKSTEPHVQSLTQLIKLSHLERLEHIDELSSFSDYSPRLEVYDVDYRKVPIPEGAVVYADPPYANTEGYGVEFSNADFWRWVDAQPFPVFVSEYEAPAGFAEVWSTSKRCTLGSAAGARQTTERLYVQERFADAYKPKVAQAAALFAGDELLEATA